MHDHYASSPAVVVGIDGSRSAVGAALWAVDEAVSRDIPLRLVSAIDPSDHPNADPEDAARELATAEIAVRQAYTAVESTDKPVKIEIEILQKNPTRALIESSRSRRAAVRRLHRSETQQPGPDRVHRSGIGCCSALPSCCRPRVRLAPGKPGLGRRGTG